MKRDPTQWLKITRAVNGYVLEYDRHLDDGGIRREFITVQENDVGDEAECAQRLLFEILEHFGVYRGVNISLDSPDESK